MSDSKSERVNCPDCGKGYRWQESLVGRVVPCKQCHTEFIVPDAPGVGQLKPPAPDTGEDIYELDLGEESQPSQAAAPAVGGKCPSCNSPVKDHAVICLNCGFNMQEGTKIQTAVAAPIAPTEIQPANEPPPTPISKRDQRDHENAATVHAEHRWIDYKLPTILIIVGCLLVLINNFLLAPNAPFNAGLYSSHAEAMLAYTIDVVYSTVIHCGLLFAGLFVLLWLFGSSFGAIGSVLLKVLAITLFTQEIDFLTLLTIDFMTGSSLLAFFLSWFVYLSLMIVLCIKLFDLDAAEIRVLIAFIIVGKMITNFTLAILLALIL